MYKSSKKSLVNIGWLITLVFPLLLTACGGTPKVDWELTITGDVATPVTYSFDQLATMEMVDLADVLMEKSRGEDEVRSFSGVPLAKLLENAGVTDNYSTITAKAADGYAIEISRDEMVNGIIALKQSDEWIVDADPNAGPIRLVFPETPANRWVFQINEIIVNP